jgi:hypothetical protein
MQTTVILAAVFLLASTSSALAHGIAGNRYFPGTLTFDDPAVADELFIPLYGHLEHPTREGGEATDDAFSLTFLRLLTPKLAIGGDSTWLRRARDGFSTRTAPRLETEARLLVHSSTTRSGASGFMRLEA